MKENIMELAADLLAKSEVVTLASVNEEGYPRICAMANIKSEGVQTLWMATGTHSKKTEHFRKNSKGSVCAYAEGDSLTLLGNVSVISDGAVKQSLWQDWFIKHFPKGVDDPEYCVLKFEALEATIYINEVFETHTL